MQRSAIQYKSKDVSKEHSVARVEDQTKQAGGSNLSQALLAASFLLATHSTQSPLWKANA
jgi:hypothetical protein